MTAGDIKLLLVVMASITTGYITDAEGSSTSQSLCFCPGALASEYINIGDISENTTIGSALLNTTFVGNDSQIRLTFNYTNNDISFDPVSRNLIVERRLEVLGSTPRDIQLQIICTVIATGVPVVYQVVITVWDTNDHVPQFVGAPFAANVSELTAVGTVIFSSMSATDLDPTDQNYLGFYIAPGPYSSTFSIPSLSNGQIVLQKGLNYELVQTINLTILVKDNIVNWTCCPLGQLQPQFTATTSMIITIVGVANRNPIFSRTTYTGVCDTSSIPGSVIALNTPITAIAQEANSTCNCIYTIVSGNDAGSYFSVGNTTGVISLLKPVASSGTLAFQVQATSVNIANQYSRALVLITVTDSGDSMPQFTFSSYNCSVVEGLPVGTLVTTVSASVRDSENLTYSFLFEQPLITDFTINSKTGNIFTTAVLMYDVASNYTLQIEASDSRYAAYATVFVTVLRRFASAVEFVQPYYAFNVTSYVTTVGRVQAISEDPKYIINYSLIENFQLFSIDSTGVISAVNTLTSPTYTLVAVAECNDTIGLVSRDTAVVTVLVGGVAVPVASSDNVVAVIIVAVIAGLLLLILVFLIIYICRLRRRKPEKAIVMSAAEAQKHVGVYSEGIHQNFGRKSPDLKDGPSTRDSGEVYRAYNAYHLSHCQTSSPSQTGSGNNSDKLFPDDVFVENTGADYNLHAAAGYLMNSHSSSCSLDHPHLQLQPQHQHLEQHHQQLQQHQQQQLLLQRDGYVNVFSSFSKTSGQTPTTATTSTCQSPDSFPPKDDISRSTTTAASSVGSHACGGPGTSASLSATSSCRPDSKYRYTEDDFNCERQLSTSDSAGHGNTGMARGSQSYSDGGSHSAGGSQGHPAGGSQNHSAAGESSGNWKTPTLPVASNHYAAPKGALLVNGGTRFGQGPAQALPSLRLMEEDDFGTSSTETLVQPVTPPGKKKNKVSFVDNNIDYTSSLESTMTASQTTVARPNGEAPHITVYY